MAQQFIDFGTFPNDPSADPIRSAFLKIQDNFTDLYNTTLVSGVSNVYVGPGLDQNDNSGNIFITANIPYIKIQTANGLTVDVGSYSPSSSNANVTAAATPFVIGLSNTITTTNANFAGNVRIGNLTANFVTSALVPNANVTYDLGTPTNRWKDLYLSGNTLFLGPQTIGANTSGVVFSNVIVTTNISVGNITVSGNIGVSNISATGTASVTGNATVGNLSTAGAITATGNIAGGNLSIAGVVTATGTATAGNLSTAGTVTATGTATVGNLSTAGTVTATGTATVGNLSTGGTVDATGNLTSGNVSTGRVTATGNISTSGHLTVTANATVNNLSVTTYVSTDLIPYGNQTQDLGTSTHRWKDLYLSGSSISLGSQTITSNSAGILVANIIVSGNSTSDNVIANTVSVTSATATGNITGGNVITGGIVTATGNVTGGNLRTSGLILATGDITGANINALDDLSSEGNITATGNLYISGNASVNNFTVANYVVGNFIPYGNETQDLGTNTHRWRDLYLSGQTLKLGTSTISSDANTGAIVISTATITGNLDAGNVSATYVGGTLTNNAQPNITTVGILANLSVAGDISTGNISVVGDLSANTMNVTGSFSAATITGNVIVPPGGTVAAPGSSSQLLFNDGGNTSAVAGMTFDKTSNLLTITGNVSGGNLVTSGALGGASATGTLNTLGANAITANGNVTGGNLVTSGILAATGNITGGNVITNGFLEVVGNASMGNITAVNSITGNVVSISGNISGANLVATGILKVDGNANVGNLTTAGSLSSLTVTATSNIAGGNLTTGGVVSATGNVIGGNLRTGGLILATGNITGGNFDTSGTITSTGNGTFGNVSGGTFTATLFSGNGASITGLNILNASTTVVVTSVAGTGSIATVGFATRSFAPFTAGQSITIAGVTPIGYNTTATVLTCSTSAVTYSSTATGSVGFVSGAGTIAGGTKASAALQSDTVVSSSQPNITSVGTLTGLTLSGSLTGTDVTSSGFFLTSVGSGIAAAGTTQSGATALTKQVNVITSVAAGTNDGIKLPTATVGMQVIIVNTTAVAVKVYPATGGTIDTIAANGAFSLGAGARLMIVATGITQWYTMVGVYG